MRRILLLFLFAFPFFASAQTITATCKKLNVKERNLDETHPATITITITDKQPDPGHYTLEGKYFVTICINDKANPNKTIYFNALDKNSKVKYVPAEYILGLPSSNIFLFTGIYEEPIMLYTANGSLLVAGFNEQLYVIEYPSPLIWNEFLKVAMESIDAKEQTDKTNIEPYQSTAVRDIRNKNDLNFEVNGVKFTMIEVEGGTFTMGDNSNRVGEQYANNKPAHNVTLSSFYIAQTEVTQELWHAVMGKWPESYKGPKYPVNDVSWDDCQKFIKKLNSITGKKFRLPTEAEWEFAARGGNMSKGYKYAGSNTINDVSWYSTNSLYGTHEVATKKPNELGIYDMSGNSIEWCQDWYDYNYYKSSPSINPIGPKSGKQRVLRGGGWKQDDRATCLSRYFDSPKRDVFKGFRLAIGKDN